MLGQCSCMSQQCPWSKGIEDNLRRLMHCFAFISLDRIKHFLWLGPPIVYRRITKAAENAEKADTWVPGQSGNLMLASTFEVGRGSGRDWDTFCDFLDLAFKARKIFKGIPETVCDNKEVCIIPTSNQYLNLYVTVSTYRQWRS